MSDADVASIREALAMARSSTVRHDFVNAGRWLGLAMRAVYDLPVEARDAMRTELHAAESAATEAQRVMLEDIESACAFCAQTMTHAYDLDGDHVCGRCLDAELAARTQHDRAHGCACGFVGQCGECTEVRCG
jgi:hypothetical protein